jgi:D-3-phosphoglycerate dehydrogenase / 2-oxoglutarate reductase
MPYNVLVTPRSFGEGSRKPLEILEKTGCTVTRNTRGRQLSEEELLQEIGAYDGIIVGLEAITRGIIERGARLKVISKHGVGVDNIDLRAAAERRIVVANTPGVNSHAVADLAIGLMLSIARQIPRNALIATQRGKKGVMGRELHGKVLGIVGFGRIGVEVAARAKGFGMDILYTDAVRKPQEEGAPGATFVSIHGLVTQSDFVSLHLPLTAQTEGFFGTDLIGRMKRQAYLINTSRAEIIDEEELARALTEGRLAGAAVDVYRENSPLLGLDNAICLPHVGAYTFESVENMGIISAENAVRVLMGQEPLYRVDKWR